MVQGVVKLGKNSLKKDNKAVKAARQQQKEKKFAKKGSSVKLPSANNKFRNEALDDRELSKAITKANEQKIAAKLLQDGGNLGSADLSSKGKELAKELRRSQVKKKLTRVEEKLRDIRAQAEKEGRI